MARKYRQGMESGGRDSNPEMRRRDWIKLIVGAGAAGGLVYLSSKYLIDSNPQAIEKWCNEMMRRNNDPDAVENIEERIARYEKELEEKLEYAVPIRTFEGLNSVRRNLRGNYKQVGKIVCPQGHNWEPIGTFEHPFVGTYNGQDFPVEDLCAIWPQRDYVGMFGCVGNGQKRDGIISYLKLKNVKILGREQVGVIFGLNCGALILNIYSCGSLKGNLYCGGIGGVMSEGILVKCQDVGEIIGTQYVGGLVGSNHQGYVIDSLPNDYVVYDPINYKGSLIGRNFTWHLNSDDYSEHIINSPGTIGLDTTPKPKK